MQFGRPQGGGWVAMLLSPLGAVRPGYRATLIQINAACVACAYERRHVGQGARTAARPGPRPSATPAPSLRTAADRADTRAGQSNRSFRCRADATGHLADGGRPRGRCAWHHDLAQHERRDPRLVLLFRRRRSRHGGCCGFPAFGSSSSPAGIERWAPPSAPCPPAAGHSAATACCSRPRPRALPAPRSARGCGGSAGRMAFAGLARDGHTTSRHGDRRRRTPGLSREVRSLLLGRQRTHILVLEPETGHESRSPPGDRHRTPRDGGDDHAAPIGPSRRRGPGGKRAAAGVLPAAGGRDRGDPGA